MKKLISKNEKTEILLMNFTNQQLQRLRSLIVNQLIIPRLESKICNVGTMVHKT